MVSMNWADTIIVLIIIGSVIISLIRGFIKEAISLVSWLTAAWLAVVFAKPVSKYITFTQMSAVKVFIAFLLIFIATVFIGAIVNYTIGRVVRNTPFSVPDRTLGMIFGFARGIIVVGFLVLLAGLTPFPKEPWWQASYMVVQFQNLAEWLRDRFPNDVAQHFVFPVTYQEE